MGCELCAQRRQAVAEAPHGAEQPLGGFGRNVLGHQYQADRGLRRRFQHPHPEIIVSVGAQLCPGSLLEGSRQALRQGCSGLRGALADPECGDKAALAEQ